MFDIIKDVITKLNINAVLHGIYLNYYQNGRDWTPNHSHKDMRQVIISLGASLYFTSKIET